MSYYHPLWAAPTPAELQKGNAAVVKARLVGARSEREEDYIRALGVFYRGAPAIDHKTRVVAYNDAMAVLHRKYPTDHQATLFYALSLVAVGMIVHDPSFAREKQAGALINEVLAAEPDNPGAWHYTIHSFDYPALAELALPAARRYALVAPEFRACTAHAVAHLHASWPVENSSNRMSRLRQLQLPTNVPPACPVRGTSSYTQWITSLTLICRPAATPSWLS